MAWGFDRTGEALVWAGVSCAVALILNTLGCSYSYWVFLGCWLLTCGTAITLSYLKVSGTCKKIIIKRLGINFFFLAFSSVALYNEPYAGIYFSTL